MADRQGVIHSICGVPRALLGVLHLPALPGTPRYGGSVDDIVATAVAEAEAYHAAGFDGLVIENMHDRPYLRGTVGPEVVATMAAVGREVRRAVPLALGVQVLAGANREALAVALACDAAFVRVEGFVFAHVADEGLIESTAGEILRYRRAIGAEKIRVFADVKKKHSSHALTADIDLVETARAAEFFLVDGVVVTGTETGVATAAGEVGSVAEAVNVPTLVGSGATAGNVGDYAAADAVIVGSWVKQGGHWANALDRRRLDAMVEAFVRTPSPEPDSE